MPFDSYQSLREAVLSWLARPGDLLVAPSVPDMITLAESELRRRLRVGNGEQRAAMTTVAGTPAVALPADCRQVRLVTSSGQPLDFVTPNQLPGGVGEPRYFTLHGRQLRLGPAPSGAVQVELLYYAGLPPLSDLTPSNWLLDEHPDAYLYSTLTLAEAFIGHDERIPLWLQAREAAIASIESADRKARWNGSPLEIRVDGITSVSGGSAAAGAWTPIPPVISVLEVTHTTVLPMGTFGEVNIRNTTSAPIEITLPVLPIEGQWLRFKDVAGNLGTYTATLLPVLALTSDSGLVLTTDDGVILTAPGRIDGMSEYEMMGDFMSLEIYWMGTQWGTR